MGMNAILPEALSRQLEIYKLTFRLREYGSSTVNRLLASVEASADVARIERLRQEMRQVYRESPTSAAKYANRRYWLLLNIERAVQLQLHRSSPLRILDIGCGPGYFLAVTRALGHQFNGIDAPESYLTPVERRVYSELLDALNCRQHVSPVLIERFAPLPLGDARYDLITAFWICFNRHCQPDTWGVDEWRFFIDDAARHLNANGRILLELNEDRERFGDLRFYDEPTLAYFRTLGTVDGPRILIKHS